MEVQHDYPSPHDVVDSTYDLLHALDEFAHHVGDAWSHIIHRAFEEVHEGIDQADVLDEQAYNDAVEAIYDVVTIASLAMEFHTLDEAELYGWEVIDEFGDMGAPVEEAEEMMNEFRQHVEEVDRAYQDA